MRASIVVCPLSKLPQTLRQSGAGHVVTLLAQAHPCCLPILGERPHLWISLSDVAEPLAGHVMPGEAHIRDLIAFTRAWPRRSPLLIHCYAGVSRSTAAAYAALCALCPTLDEAEAAARLRMASPTATPNPRIVALARCGTEPRRPDDLRRPWPRARSGLFRGECLRARGAGLTRRLRCHRTNRSRCLPNSRPARHRTSHRSPRVRSA